MTAAVLGAIPCALQARIWWDEAIVMADQHARYEVAHPGWSFPATLQTAAVPLDTPKKRLIAEAKARGYVEDCKKPEAGEFCAKTGKVVPRSGDALEPIIVGVLLGPDGELRTHLPLQDAPKHLIDAILSAEDRDYREHFGVNLSSMARAAWANYQEGSYVQGGSTLTMQVVRNLDQRKEKTVLRKVREMVMAAAIDHHLGKDGVLQMYLDAPYLGQNGNLPVCGFQAASQFYFAKDAPDLSLAEAATLAAILPAPGRYAPDRYPERARELRDRVLVSMRENLGYDVAAALAEPIVTHKPDPLPSAYPAWYSATRAYLEQHLPPQTLYGAGLTITLGIDVPLQELTNEVFKSKVPFLESLIGRRKAPLQAAGILMDKDTGLILAIWGGNDVTPTSFNRAFQARRQAGSSFKSLVYALAMSQPDHKYTAATTMPNMPKVFKTPQGDWKPRNVKGEYSPTASLAHAIAASQNVATASLLEELGGPTALIKFAETFGFDTTRLPAEMGLALGQGEVTVLEMTQFAAAVANGGLRIEGSPVLSAVDPAGVQRIGPPVAGEAVLSPEAAALTREMMRLVVVSGTGGTARGAGGEPGYQGDFFGKTGTTDADKDLWFVGGTPRYAASVWVGYDIPASMNWSASDISAPLWGWWLGRLTRGETAPTFPEEPPISRRTICRYTGKLSNGTCHTIQAPFAPGTDPKAGCPISHPPPEAEEPKLDANGNPIVHESLWKKLAREKAEAEQAAAPAP